LILPVVLIVLLFAAAIGGMGYLIDRNAERHERRK